MRSVYSVEEFCVAWKPTRMPESDLGGARELVDECRAHLSLRHRKDRQGKTEAAGESLPKRQPGRLRKQVRC
jgi:hypothetical protein